ncbi:single-stranded-DNA-specific exonuclease [Lactobacillus pasteurii DSM 23907 = CRBIP 24.76]|uniref:Single-stranded-DNA-specific exonuclease RecJ n=1 Tax=Lactobacillus pasteurii DSM 23907 = CRBIP 24.76 TaxID=1423790 RepID=I7LBK6_9LACO|nr:single-stranded-DNA-specific exonuclease RecJ [Lactobacillus pasteurii]KRK08467.1 single-stranded-DNA-specific exonuclease [Lactobacillus pasteurii DSM 23907 = CRBIP 24.76]TDG75645.1 hypothetical protein C5L33_000530 [Lactobacillus pasteurii]CCI85676.1 Recombination protein J [Lactobacillus pasteurii DSM 23907 = CRBIP 24.76]
MKWIQRTGKELDPELVNEYQLSPVVAKLFSLRGITSEEQLDYWFNATEEDLADPFLMHDMNKAVNRIMQAIDNGEKITIYGDYDADGITATSIMVETLGILGAEVDYFIPDRFKDGYGPNLARYKEIVEGGTKLIITVDNGVTGVEEVAYAQEHGVDVILTDHHTFQDDVPKPYALVHCNYPGQAYPFDDYCGAGVAYTICRALMQDPMTELLDLAMIGTIGDMVKVNGEGHIIVKRGLAVLNETERPGLRALIEQAGLSLGNISDTDVGFSIAPRLNATGRMANASLAVKLLLSDNEDEAVELAKQIEQLNDERKECTNEVYASCMKQIKQFGKRNTYVIYDQDFHEGVLGLVANKIVEKTHKPTLVLTKDPEGMLKGSGRSKSGFNLFNALEPLKENILTKFGGHDFACGLSLTESKLPELIEAFEDSFKLAEGTQDSKQYDFDLKPSEFTLDLLDQIASVGPFGTANPKPIFSISQPQINKLLKMGKDHNHIKLSIGKNNLQIVGFNMPYIDDDLLPYINKVYVQASLNTFRNQQTVQAIIEGIDYAAPSLIRPEKIIDMRSQPYVMGFADKYLLFDKKNLPEAQHALGIDPSKIQLVADYQADDEVVVLLDLPHNQQELEQVLSAKYKQIYLRFLLDQLPVEQIPAKSYFGKALKYVYAHPGLKPEDYALVGPYLGLNGDSMTFVLRVFFELGFVKLDNGLIVPVKNPEKKPLTDSKYLMATSYQLNFAKQLRTMPTGQLIEYVNNHLN